MGLPFDQNELVSRHPPPVLPGMLLIIAHTIDLSDSLRVLQHSRDQIGFGVQRPKVAEG